MPRTWAHDQVGRIVRDLRSRTEHGARRMMFDLAMHLERRTPKDTHHAASNWVWNDTPRMVPEGSRNYPTYEAFTSGLLSLSRWGISSGAIYLTNAVHYIKKLDEGYSPQAPAGFIRTTIRKVLRQHTSSKIKSTE